MEVPGMNTMNTERICPVCGEPVPADRGPLAIYCSAVCQRRASARRYNAEHKEERRRYAAEYYTKHKEERRDEKREYSRRYAAEHKEELREYKRRYNAAHKEERHEYYAEHRDEHREYSRRRHVEPGARGWSILHDEGPHRAHGSPGCAGRPTTSDRLLRRRPTGPSVRARLRAAMRRRACLWASPARCAASRSASAFLASWRASQA
jgi:hypothetical protein